MVNGRSGDGAIWEGRTSDGEDGIRQRGTVGPLDDEQDEGGNEEEG